MRSLLAKLGDAFVGVSNAFVVLALVTAMYAIVGVELFGSRQSTTKTICIDDGDDDDDELLSPRCFGLGMYYQELYGNFLKATLTNFQAQRAVPGAPGQRTRTLDLPRMYTEIVPSARTHCAHPGPRAGVDRRCLGFGDCEADRERRAV